MKLKKGLVQVFMMLFFAAILVFLGLGIYPGSVQSKETVPSEGGLELDIITIDNQGYRKNRKGPVQFSHKKHSRDYKILCWECHHDFQGEENVWSPWGETEQCKSCHDPRKKIGEVPNLQKAYHLDCKNCHKMLAEQDQKTGPYKKCADCHEKE